MDTSAIAAFSVNVLSAAAQRKGQASDFGQSATKTAAKATDPNSPGGAALKALAEGKSTKVAASTAGTVAGGAACAAAVITAPAAPLCALVGGLVGGLIHDGVFALGKARAKRRRRIRRSFKDVVANQEAMDAALETTLQDLVLVWKRLAPRERPISHAQIGDVLRAVGLPLVWDIPRGTEDRCREGMQAKAAWRVPFYQSLMYSKPSLVRYDVRCQYGDVTPTVKEIKAREPAADAGLETFDSKFADAVDKAGSLLISFAAERAAVRMLFDEKDREIEIIEARSRRNREIRNVAFITAATLSATALAWKFLYAGRSH